MARTGRLKDCTTFAISKSKSANPFLDGYFGYVYTKHYIKKGRLDGKDKWWIVNEELSKEEALDLIEGHKMSVALQNEAGIIWDTSPSLRSACKKLGLTYTNDLRPY